MKRKETISELERKTTKSLIITLSLMIIALGATYLTMLSTGAQNGYTLEMQKLKQQELYTNMQKIQSQITDKTALKTLKEESKNNKMTNSPEKTFILE